MYEGATCMLSSQSPPLVRLWLPHPKPGMRVTWALVHEPLMDLNPILPAVLQSHEDLANMLNLSSLCLPIGKTRVKANGNLLYDSGNSKQGTVTTLRGRKQGAVGGRFKRKGTRTPMANSH